MRYLLLAVAMAATSFSASAGNLRVDSDLLGTKCELKSGYGPYDYRSREYNSLPSAGTTATPKQLVEPSHFTPKVEQLVGGESAIYPGPDLDYTLRAIPNHHRALGAMARLALREKTPIPVGMRATPGCYFDRALTFAPDDAMVRVLFASYLYKIGKLDDGLKFLEEAEKMDGTNAMVHYNLGLFYIEKKDFGRARTHAKKAYALGSVLPGLKQKLIRIGQWQE